MKKVILYITGVFVSAIPAIWIGVFLGRLIIGLFINVYEEANNIPSLMLSAVLMAAVCAALFTMLCVGNKSGREAFMATDNSADIKKYLKIHMQKNGKRDFFLYAVYSVPMVIIMTAVHTDTTLIADSIGLLAIFLLYLLNLAAFAAAYILWVSILFKKWHKKWYIDKEFLNSILFNRTER